MRGAILSPLNKKADIFIRLCHFFLSAAEQFVEKDIIFSRVCLLLLKAVKDRGKTLVFPAVPLLRGVRAALWGTASQHRVARTPLALFWCNIALRAE